MTPSGLAISSGQGQGWAQELGGSSFDPVAFAEGLAAERAAADLARAKAETDRINRTRKFLTELKPTDVNKWNQEDIEKDMEAFETEILGLAQRGVDPETSKEGREALNKGRINILEKKSKGDFIQGVINKNLELLSAQRDKYDPQQYEEWIKGLEALPTLDERTEYAMKVPAFKSTFDTNAFLDDIVKATPIDVLETAGRVYEKGDPVKAKEILFSGIDNLLLTPQGKAQVADTVQQAFDAGHIAEPTTDAFKDYLFTQVEPRLKSSSRVAPKRDGGDFNVSVGGYSAPKDVSVAGKPYINPKDGKAAGNGELYEVSVKLKGKDLAPMEVVDRNGKITYFKPSQYYKVTPGLQSGLPAGSWAVKGQVYGRPGEEKIKEGESAEAARARIMELYPDAEVVPKGDGVSFTVYKPLKTDVISYDKNDIRFKTALEGFDIYEYEQGWNKANAGKTTGKTTEAKADSKTIPASTVKSLVGKKGYEGYTEKELIEYYKSQGYTIK